MRYENLTLSKHGTNFMPNSGLLNKSRTTSDLT